MGNFSELLSHLTQHRNGDLTTETTLTKPTTRVSFDSRDLLAQLTLPLG